MWFLWRPSLCRRLEYKLDQVRHMLMTLTEAVAALTGAIAGLDAAVQAEIAALKAAMAANDPVAMAAAVQAISDATAKVMQDTKDLNDSMAPPAPPPPAPTP